MYIGMRGHDFDTNTLDALCEKCKEYGVGGVQLVLLRSCWCIVCEGGIGTDGHTG